MRTWKFKTAQLKFGTVIDRALTLGPQTIAGRRGKNERVVVVSAQVYEQLTARKKQPENLFEFLRQSPLVGSGIDLERDREPGRRRSRRS